MLPESLNLPKYSWDSWFGWQVLWEAWLWCFEMFNSRRGFNQDKHNNYLKTLSSLDLIRPQDLLYNQAPGKKRQKAENFFPFSSSEFLIRESFNIWSALDKLINIGQTKRAKDPRIFACAWKQWELLTATLQKSKSSLPTREKNPGFSCKCFWRFSWLKICLKNSLFFTTLFRCPFFTRRPRAALTFLTSDKGKIHQDSS